jgi:hypothetical protein
MKNLLITIAFFCVHSASAQLSTNVYWTEQTKMPAAEVIFYNVQKPLTWLDFKGKPEQASPASAITASGFGYKADLKNKGTKGQLNVGIYCYFNKNNSWVKEGKAVDYILTHEQNHFNISFIAASIFVEKMKAATVTINNYNIVLPRIYNECVDIMNKMHDDYDGQTKNGQLKEVQAKWNSFLSKKINLLTK